MTEPTVNRCFRLRRRPSGPVTEADLELCEEAVPQIEDGQALVRTLLLSLDPTNRIWMSDMRSYLPPVPIDAVMRGLGIGQVLASRRDDMQAGDLVSGFTGWQDLCVAGAPGEEFPFTVLPDPLPAPLTLFLGPIGHTGLTAWVGIADITKPQEGETVVVSAAAGAVGSVAGQLAKARGARVVGIAGGPEKCRHVVEDLGFDACVDYKAGDWREQLAAATPDGIDVDFENVGGAIMDEVFLRLNLGARVALSGMISQYNQSQEGWGAQMQIGQMITSRVLMKGFIVLDHAELFEEAIGELAGLLAEGRLKFDETIVDGLGQARDALNRLFEGTNTGKLIVRVAEPVEAGAPSGATGATA
ncbi:MAG TPA: NADP-dependent oxidoreductase [Baekduia sp.]|nr:NADP-dependent oxidoreductase [Baekduia sp.]